MQKILDLKNRINETNNYVKANAVAALEEAFNDFLVATPEISDIIWSQFTPYWLDGDVCEFTIHDPYFIKSDENLNLDTSGYFEDFDVNDCYNFKGAQDHDLYEKFIKFMNSIQDEQIYLAAFGDHVIVHVNRAAIKTHSYDNHY